MSTGGIIFLVVCVAIGWWSGGKSDDARVTARMLWLILSVVALGWWLAVHVGGLE